MPCSPLLVAAHTLLPHANSVHNKCSNCSFIPHIKLFGKHKTIGLLGDKVYLQAIVHLVVSIGRLAAFYVVLVPMELIPSKPPPYAYVIVSFCTLQKCSTF